jgi:putative oxidoreductase
MKIKILDSGSLNNDLAALVLRLILGSLFIYHGYNKISAYNKMAPMFPDLIGIGSELTLILVIFAEFFCGILVTLGFLTRFAVIPIFITMVVAFFIAHAKDVFNAKELALVFMILSIVIFILGSGKYSLDRLILKR